MASTSNIKQTCMKCNKSGGIAICSGCQLQYCVKHFVEHRQELTVQMDEIGQEHDLLRRDLSKETSDHPLLARIDAWEQESITKILVAADVARADLRQLLDQRRNELKVSIDRITSEYQSSQELEDYTEIDIEKWTKRIKKLRLLLETPIDESILSEDLTQAAIHLIKMKTSPLSPLRTQERFDKLHGSVMLLEKDLVAKNIGEDYSRICGYHQYSFGVHQVHFRIDERANSCPFLGIISLLDEFNLLKMTLSSANGWSDLDYPIINGKNQGSAMSNRTIQSGDEVTFIVDCENREILLEHHRTNRIVRLAIDIEECPFPWKILVALSSGNSSIRILQERENRAFN